MPVGLGLSMAGMAPANMVASAVRAEKLGFITAIIVEPIGPGAVEALAEVWHR